MTVLYIFTGEDGVAILELGEEQEVVLDMSVTNTGESAYEAALHVSHPHTLSFIGRVSEANQLECNAFNGTMVVCALGNPFKRGYFYALYPLNSLIPLFINFLFIFLLHHNYFIIVFF